MQGLVHLIGEECVFLHLPGEGSAAYQVRVEKQGISLRVGGLPVIVDAADLPRGDCNFAGVRKPERTDGKERY